MSDREAFEKEKQELEKEKMLIVQAKARYAKLFDVLERHLDHQTQDTILKALQEVE